MSVMLEARDCTAEPAFLAEHVEEKMNKNIELINLRDC